MLRTASVEHIDALNHHVKNTGVLPSGDGGEMEQAPSPPLFQAMVQRLYAQYSSVVGLVAAENSPSLPLPLAGVFKQNCPDANQDQGLVRRNRGEARIGLYDESSELLAYAGVRGSCSDCS
ncbi:hypothetical protein NMY22_g9500 [Coprinellus aureogranulatus]|nr:hypothetical protein NMY22_g9500 [Coprinellus aureogranulatus]